MAGLIAALLIPFVFFFQPMRLIEARLYDILSVIAPPAPDKWGAVIVAIDEPSIGEVGQRWPWSREIHGKLVESLRAAGAKVIAFDIVFADPPYGRRLGEAALAAARDGGWLKPGALAVLEEGRGAPFDEVAGFRTVDERDMGASVLRFLRLED